MGDVDYAEIDVVTLHRGPCFGRCPLYSVTLRADGSANWDGERFVDRLGPHEGRVHPDDFARLARFLARVRFLEWEPEHLGGATDLPDFVLTVQAGDHSHRVRQNGTDEPPDFWVAAALVDHLAEAVAWQPSGEGACRDWTAVLNREPPGPAVLTVRGVCTVLTAGYEVELLRHEPQGINPRDLLLRRVVRPPSDVVAQVVTDLEVVFTEQTHTDYDTVTILPDGVTIPVRIAS